MTTHLLRWREGDRAAGDRLFAALEARLRPWLLRTTRDLGVLDGDDVLQDVFLTFLHHAPDFDVSAGDAGLLGWFRTTLRRRWWSMSAGARRHVPVGDDLVAMADDEVGHAGEARAEAASRLRILEAVAADPERVRVSGRNRRKIAHFIEHVGAVVLGDSHAAGTTGEIGERVGWSPFQLWRMKGRLRDAVAQVAEPAVPAIPAETPPRAVAVASAPAPAPEPRRTRPGPAADRPALATVPSARARRRPGASRRGRRVAIPRPWSTPGRTPAARSLRFQRDPPRRAPPTPSGRHPPPGRGASPSSTDRRSTSSREVLPCRRCTP
ncbi:MAG: hypothetical protein ACQEXJ_12315 [Myxococcota bacterium]